ncbi:MAG: class I SAM-dependent methyltransferase [Jatrophihabitans sp.]
MTLTVPAATSGRARVFDYMQGHVVTSVVAALEALGALDRLAADGLRASDLGPNKFLADATLRYLAQRDLVRREQDGIYRFTEIGRELYESRGYLVWLGGGYAEPLARLDRLINGEQSFGVEVDRNVRWVAVGTAEAGRRDLRPEVLTLLREIEFERAVDIGCGNAHFLIGLCGLFGASGIGIDISPDACAEALQEVASAGMQDRIRIVRANACEVASVPELENVQLVVASFFLHEVLEGGVQVLVDYLRAMCQRLPVGAHLMAAEIAPPREDHDTGELVSPEYTLTQALMKQILFDEQQWRQVFTEAGFEVVKVVHPNLPEAQLILARKPS